MAPPRTVRAHVRAHRPAHDPDTLEPVAERRIVLDDTGGVLELEITEPFACRCPRERPIGFRCAGCGLLFCHCCPNTGHTRSSIPLCGGCSRVVVHRDGSVERVARRGYWKRRACRFVRAARRAVLSLLLDPGARP